MYVARSTSLQTVFRSGTWKRPTSKQRWIWHTCNISHKEHINVGMLLSVCNPSLISLMFSVDVKHHVYLLTSVCIVLMHTFNLCGTTFGIEMRSVRCSVADITYTITWHQFVLWKPLDVFRTDRSLLHILRRCFPPFFFLLLFFCHFYVDFGWPSDVNANGQMKQNIIRISMLWSWFLKSALT